MSHEYRHKDDKKPKSKAKPTAKAAEQAEKKDPAKAKAKADAKSGAKAGTKAEAKGAKKDSKKDGKLGTPKKVETGGTAGAGEDGTRQGSLNSVLAEEEEDGRRGSFDRRSASFDGSEDEQGGAARRGSLNSMRSDDDDDDGPLRRGSMGSFGSLDSRESRGSAELFEGLGEAEPQGEPGVVYLDLNTGLHIYARKLFAEASPLLTFLIESSRLQSVHTAHSFGVAASTIHANQLFLCVHR